MAQRQALCRSNRVLGACLPLLVLGLAFTETSLSGTAHSVTQVVFALALVAFIVRVTTKAPVVENELRRPPPPMESP
jgi:hypothetical protein